MGQTMQQAQGRRNPFRERLEREIDAATLREGIDDRSFYASMAILDVRKREDYEKGHVPGAISMPYEDLKDKLDELPRGKQIVTYCYHAGCLLGTRAAARLADAGFDVRDLLGGFRTWKDEGHPVQQ